MKEPVKVKKLRELTSDISEFSSREVLEQSSNSQIPVFPQKTHSKWRLLTAPISWPISIHIFFPVTMISHSNDEFGHLPCSGQRDINRNLTSTYKFLLALLYNWIYTLWTLTWLWEHTGLAHGWMNNLWSWGMWPEPRPSYFSWQPVDLSREHVRDKKYNSASTVDQ